MRRLEYHGAQSWPFGLSSLRGQQIERMVASVATVEDKGEGALEKGERSGG
jgi:hypothetical protein